MPAQATGLQTYDLSTLTPLATAADLSYLVPSYLEEIPERDGWGHPFEYRFSGDVLSERAMSIRSPGKDGRFEGDVYSMGQVAAEDYDRDIVWADGFFVQYPKSFEVK